MRPRAAFFLTALLLSNAAYGANRSSVVWEEPKPIDPNTVFFGEKPREKTVLSEAPSPADKSYPWYCLEKGNNHYLNREYDKASIYFKAAFAVPGSTRVLSGFRLIDAYQKLGWTDLALETLDSLEKHYLASTREFQEAHRIRMDLEDRKRRGPQPRVMPPMTGREWVLELQDWRLKYVLGAMNELHRHGIPLKEEAQGYVFLLDEYFLANPSLQADDAVKILADFIYDRDPEARLPIDRWRMNPEGTLTEEAKADEEKPGRLMGAQWVTMTQDDKLDYVAQAMKVLENQRVPMEKTQYAYVDALDLLFTDKPDLPAWDGATALASYLYENEPKARAVLEALRLE